MEDVLHNAVIIGRPNYILAVDYGQSVCLVPLQTFGFRRFRHLQAVRSKYDVGFWRIKYKPKKHKK